MSWNTVVQVLCATSVILLCLSRGIVAGDTFIPTPDPEQYDDLFDKADSDDTVVSIRAHRHNHGSHRGGGINKHGVSGSRMHTSTNNPSGIKIKTSHDINVDSIALLDGNSGMEYKLFKSDEASDAPLRQSESKSNPRINSKLRENDQVSAQMLKLLDNENTDDKEPYTSVLSSSLSSSSNPSSSSVSPSSSLLLSTNDFAVTSDAEKSHSDGESEVSKVSITKHLGQNITDNINGAYLEPVLHNSEHDDDDDDDDDDDRTTVREHTGIRINNGARLVTNIINNEDENQRENSDIKEAMTARQLSQSSVNQPHVGLPMSDISVTAPPTDRNSGSSETKAKFVKNKFNKKKKKKKFKKKKKTGWKKNKNYHKAKMEKIHQYFLKYSNISDEQRNRTHLHQMYHLLQDADMRIASNSINNLKEMQRERLNEIYDVYMNNSMELLKLESSMHSIGTSMSLDGHGQTEHLQVDKALTEYKNNVERMRASASRNIQLCLRDIHKQSDTVLNKLQAHLNKTKEWKFYVTDQLEEVCDYLQTDHKDTMHELKQAIIQKDEQIAALTQEVEDLHEENEKLRDDTHDISLIRETMSHISVDSEMTQTVLQTMKSWLETMQQTVGDIAYPFQQITYQWKLYPFDYDNTWTDCHGPRYLKLSGYDVGHGHYVGVVLCSTSKYKIYLGENLNGKFLNIGDRSGEGQDHCEFVNSYREARFISEVIGPTTEVNGYGRAYWGQLPYKRKIGLSHGYRSPTWYDCGIAIP